MTKKSTSVRQLIDTFHKHKVTYCHWKSIDHLNASFQGETDLDILFCKKFSNKVRYLLHELGFKRLGTHHLRAYPGVEDYIKYDETTDKWIHLHAHFELILGDRWVKAYRAPWENKVLDTRIWDEKFETYIIAPHLEFILFILRMHLKHYFPFKKTKVSSELKEIKSRIPVELTLTNEVELLSLTENEKELISNCFEEKFETKILQLIKIRSDGRRFLRVALFKFYYLTIMRYFFRVYVEASRRVFKKFNFGRRQIPSGGLSVAFLGIDGAGKTSAIDRNILFFSKQMDVAKVSLGGGRSGKSFLRALLFVILDITKLFKRNREQRKKSKSQNLCSTRKMSIFQLIYHIILSFDRISRLKKIFRLRSNGSLVLVDRWPQGIFSNMLDGPRSHNSGETSSVLHFLNILENKVLSSSVNMPPDLIIKMIVSTEIAESRKPGELDNELSKKMVKNLSELEFRTVEVIEIDASQSINSLDRQLRALIFEKL